jgi:hypothetical protein
MCTKRAEVLEQEAALERERARRYLEAADARAAEKRTRKSRASGCAGKPRAADPQARLGSRPSGQWCDDDYDVPGQAPIP